MGAELFYTERKTDGLIGNKELIVAFSNFTKATFIKIS
jgi:hypothetical protein